METFKYTLTSIMCGLVANAITLYIQRTKYVDWDLVVLAVYVVGMVVVGLSAYRHSKRVATEQKRTEYANSLSSLLSILHRYASHPDVLKIIDANGKEYVGGHADNFYWKEVAAAICKGMAPVNLRYSNLGTQYFLRDMANGKTVEIPTDNRLEDKVTKTGVRNGQIPLIVGKT